MAAALQPALRDLVGVLDALRPELAAGRREALDALADLAAACQFHAGRRPEDRPVVALVGGTGTGKSTLLNRLLGRQVSANSFRRTFTSGAVLAVPDADAVPSTPAPWLGLPDPPVVAEALPVRGEPNRLTVAVVPGELTEKVLLADTPDLDGDRPEHHAVARRCFGWADAVAFVVTPEKYQLPDLPPLADLAARWRTPTVWVMNKADDAQTVADFAAQRADQDPDARLFVVPRDDSPYRPDADRDLDALSRALPTLRPDPAGAARRAADLAVRLHDQLVEPLRRDRAEATRVAARLRSLAAPAPGLDVAPMTRAVQRRLRERSVLYAIGPGKVLDRVKSLPGVLARLPRTAFDFFRDADAPADDAPPQVPTAPDFPRELRESMLALQGRIDDVLRESPLGDVGDWRLPADAAAAVAQEELDDLRRWLEDRWGGKPRDTALLEKLPGGDKVAKLSEAAPYLLTAYLAASGALFGHLDLLALGGYASVTALLERMSNEVLARTRKTNQTIGRRYAELARRQIGRAAAAAEARAVDEAALKQLAALVDRLAGPA